MVDCYKQNALSETEKSCKNQCIRKLSCYHRCLSLCHSGLCDETEKCRRKVKLVCRCKHLKKEVECFLVGDLTTDGKYLECNPAICNVPKSPKDGQSSNSNSKKRNRKKKNSEGDKQIEEDSNEQGNENQVQDLQGGEQGPVSTKLVTITVCGVVAAILFSLIFLSDSTK